MDADHKMGQGSVTLKVGDQVDGSLSIQSPAAPVTIVAAIAIAGMLALAFLFLKYGHRPRSR